MVEPLIVLLPGLGWILWAAGGTWWKGLRRYAYPLLLSGSLIAGGANWPLVVLTGVLTSVVAHLGYGDTYGWWWRLMVGGLLGGTLLPLGASPWVMLAVAGVFFWTFVLSRTWNDWSWKYAEGFTGLAHALGAVWTVTH